MIRPLAYAQAKRWKGSVGSPEIQGFIGGQQLEGAPKTQGEDSLNIDFMTRIARRKSKNGYHVMLRGIGIKHERAVPLCPWRMRNLFLPFEDMLFQEIIGNKVRACQ